MIICKAGQQDKIFINPVIVGSIPGRKGYILLDGVNRLEALKKLGIRDILAQIVNYYNPKEVELCANHHYLLDKTKTKKFLNNFKKISEIHLQQLYINKAIKDIEDNKIIGYVKLENNRKVYSLGIHKDIYQTTKVLNKIVNCYAGKTEIYRLSELHYSPRNFPVEIVFHCYTPREIIQLVANNIKLNSGITRHVIYSYIIHLNVPIKILKSNNSTQNKNKWLEKFIQDKIINKELRIYQKPVYIFDEWKKEY